MTEDSKYTKHHTYCPCNDCWEAQRLHTPRFETVIQGPGEIIAQALATPELELNRVERAIERAYDINRGGY